MPDPAGAGPVPRGRNILTNGNNNCRRMVVICWSALGYGECRVGGLMSDQKIKDEHTDNTPPKKPYERPEFRYERAFETMALSCGKMRGTQGLCRFNRKNS